MSEIGYQIARDYEKGNIQGWAGRDRPDFVREQFSLLSGNFKQFSIFGQTRETAGKKHFLHWLVRKALGKDTLNYPQQIGDCVSFGAKNAVEYVTCSQIVGVAATQFAGDVRAMNEYIQSARLKFRSVFPPYFYGTGRIYIGNGQINGDGSLGSWMADAVQKYGTLFSDEPNVPAYSSNVAQQWGSSRRVLDQWQPTAKSYLVKSAAQINSWEDLMAALANGYPCPTASSIGYSMEASSDGFHRQTTSWGHQMCFIGIDETGPEPYALILNNWGDVHGHLKDFETKEDLPLGVLRVRKADALKHIRAQETYAYSQFDGFPEQDLAKALFMLG